MRIVFFLLVLLFCFTFFVKTVSAASNYVLPYPSTMPGTVFYKLHLIAELVQQYWYFGNFGQFYYNLKKSDKYLVEAKTLFEYQQYLLGYNALIKSNEYFVKIGPSISRAKLEGKDVSAKLQIFIAASEKHMETFEQMKKDVPSKVVWSPEKAKPTQLMLHKAIDDSIAIRAKSHE